MAPARQQRPRPQPEPEPTLIDYGHRADCRTCEGFPAPEDHPYNPPQGQRRPLPGRTKADGAAAVVAAFPGTTVTDPQPQPTAREPEEEDPYALPDLTGGFVVPKGRLSADELEARLLCIRPLRELTVETDYGPKKGLECYVVEVDTDEGEWHDHGRMPMIWLHVLTELRKATPQAPWVLGRIVKRRSAVFLNPPTPKESAACRRQLAAFLEHRKANRGN